MVTASGPVPSFSVRLYAFIEAAIAISGFGLVLNFPKLTESLDPGLRSNFENHVVLNILRLVTVFFNTHSCISDGCNASIIGEATAPRETEFGEALGRLYGLNTLGAVLGAISGEMFFKLMIRD